MTHSSNLKQRAKEIFMSALEKETPEQKNQYLDEACDDEPELRREVVELLSSLKQADGFMEDKPAADLEQTAMHSTAAMRVGEAIGPYKLLEEIGEGGMGSVWVAQQSEPIKRRVALKLIKAGMDSKQVLARFEAERQALAMMDHPNIARVVDAGMTDQGRPYFAMEYVKGVPLNEYCDQAKLSVKQRLELFLPICQAVQHAHQKGIIHRDLKPSNILICLYDGKPVPKVIDFGLAKAMHQSLTEQSLYTAHGMMLGTPLYMSPEQAESNNLDIDTRTDVYSLGVILYELLTGSTPLEKAQMKQAAVNEILRLIKEVEPPTPSTRLSGSASLPSLAAQRSIDPAHLARNISGDLDWVVMKALEKERSRRYETANGLAEDIRRHLVDEPVSASPPSTKYRMQKFIKRNRAGVVAASAVAIALLLGVIGTSTGMVWALNEKDRADEQASLAIGEKERADKQAALATASAEAEKAASLVAEANEKKAIKEKAKAETEKQRAREMAYASDMNSAYQSLKLNNLGLARLLLERNIPKEMGTDFRSWEWRALWKMSQSDAVAMFGDGKAPIKWLSVSRDARWIAVGELDGGVRVWDAAKRKLAHTLWNGANQQIGTVVFAPQGERLYGTSDKGIVKCWSVPSFEETDIMLDHGSRVRAMAVSPNGELLAVHDFDGNVTLWDTTTFVKRTFYGGNGGGGQEGCIAFSPDGNFLAIGAQPRSPIIDVATGQTVSTIDQSCKYGFAFASEGKIVASGSNIYDPNVYLHRVADGEQLAVLQGHTLYVQDVAMSPKKKGRILASSAADQTIRLWDVETHQQTAVLRGHSDEIYSIEFSHDGKQLISGAKNGEIGVWNVNTATQQNWAKSLVIRNGMSSASFSHDGQLIATVNDDNSVSLRSAATLNQIGSLANLGNNNLGVRCSPVAPVLAIGDADGNLVIVNLDGKEATENELAPGAEVFPFNYSADGSLLLVLTRDQVEVQCIVWNIAHQHEQKRFSVPVDVDYAALSPDGRTIAAGQGSKVFVWNVDDMKRREVYSGIYYTDSVAWSPDGGTLAIGTFGSIARLLSAKSWEQTGLLRGHMMAVHGITFSPDGRRIATSGGPGEALKIWDVQTRQELMSQNVEGHYFGHVEFSPDGDAVMVIGGGGNLNMWQVPTLNEIHETVERTGSLFPTGSDL